MSRVPRLRMFAGPNGSGKSTIKSVIRPELLGVYINPDDIEDEFKLQGFLDLEAFGVSATAEEVFSFFRRSQLLEKADLLAATESLRLGGRKLRFHRVEVNSYVASATADFRIRFLPFPIVSISTQPVCTEHPSIGDITMVHRLYSDFADSFVSKF